MANMAPAVALQPHALESVIVESPSGPLFFATPVVAWCLSVTPLLHNVADQGRAGLLVSFTSDDMPDAHLSRHLLNLKMQRQSALCSHAPLSFNNTPELQSETTSRSTATLLCKSHWKLSTEVDREEPRLRKLLGHMSVYDRTKAFVKAQNGSTSMNSAPEENELSTYVQYQVPSFEEFRAALALQLQTLNEVRLAAAQCQDVDEYDSDEDEETDSDYDSCNGDCWSEDDDALHSDDSLTDPESEESSPCTSPTFPPAAAKHEQEDDNDIWAIRPLAPFLNPNRMVVSPR